MAKSKQMSSKPTVFAKGGNGKMFSEREAGPQKPDTTTSGGQDAPETQWAKGGSGHMFGKQHAGTQESGQTATKSGAGGKWASGGKTKMFGKQNASPAKPC